MTTPSTIPPVWSLGPQLAIAAQIANSPTPVEWEVWSETSKAWLTPACKDLRWHIAGQHVIRLKPWSPPEPPAGWQWHRAAEWTQEMLPVIDGEQMRPLMVGEVIQPGDEWLSYLEGRWQIQGGYREGVTVEVLTQFHRTTRPALPSRIPFTQETWPSGENWLRSTNGNREYHVREVDRDGVWSSNAASNQFWTWERLSAPDMQRSSDRSPSSWQLCTTEPK